MATYSGQGFDYGRLMADQDMNSYQWRFVATGSAAGYFELGTGGSGPAPIGVLQDDPRVGETGVIRYLGTTKVQAESTVVFGDFVICSSVGIAQSTTEASGAFNGIALGAVSSGSAYIEVMLVPIGNITVDNTP